MSSSCAEQLAASGIETRFVDVEGDAFEVLVCGDGPKLALCLHGFPEHGFSWRHQMPMLARLGYTVWAPNLRGYGRSPRPSGVESYAIEHLLADVVGLVDAFGRERQGADVPEPVPTLLLAHDWGGVLAWFFAMRGSRRLEKLIVMNLPHPAAMRDALRKGGRQYLRSWYAFFFQLPLLPEWWLGRNRAQGVVDAIRNMAVDKSRFPDEVLEVYRDNALQPGALTAMINWYRALLRGGGLRRQSRLGFPPIEVPTLLVWGEEDTALGIETTWNTHRYVRRLTTRYLPRVSHWVQQEAPEAVNAMVEAFVEERAVPEVRWELLIEVPDADEKAGKKSGKAGR